MPLQRLLHRLNDNTRSGSRRNIAAHYDLGNDFYRLFLDPTMAYSCGIFERRRQHPGGGVHRQVRPHLPEAAAWLPDMRLLEIGTGWGGFAIHAARNYGCHVTTTTISQQQHDLARRADRGRRAGRADHAAAAGLPRPRPGSSTGWSRSR